MNAVALASAKLLGVFFLFLFCFVSCIASKEKLVDGISETHLSLFPSTGVVAELFELLPSSKACELGGLLAL
jgi:hypothetical protein